MSADVAIDPAAMGWMRGECTAVYRVAHAAVAWHGVPNGATSRADRLDAVVLVGVGG